MDPKNLLKVALPKGRLFSDVFNILLKAGFKLSKPPEKYFRVESKEKNILFKIFKNRDISPLVASGIYDLGFTSFDWIKENRVEVVELLDLRCGVVKIVAAIHRDVLVSKLLTKKVVCATEYVHIASEFLDGMKLKYNIIPTSGSSESYPPEDSDMIIDIYNTGETVKKNNLKIWQELFTSSLRLIVNPKIYEQKGREVNSFKEKLWIALKGKSF